MLANGLEVTLVETGSEENAIVLRRSANSELVSQIDREGANIIAALPGVAVAPDGKPMVSTETYVVINLQKKENNDMGNISVRGFPNTPSSCVRRCASWQVACSGSAPTRSSSGAACRSASRARSWAGDPVRRRKLTISASATAPDRLRLGDLGDVDQFMPAFGRPVFSSMTFRIAQRDAFEGLKRSVEQDPRTQYVR